MGFKERFAFELSMMIQITAGTAAGFRHSQYTRGFGKVTT
jgi:hypothetical protein